MSNYRLSKAQLLEQVESAHNRLESVLTSIPHSQWHQLGAGWEGSVVDHLYHLTFWQQRMLAIMRGESRPLAEGNETWDATLDRVNATLQSESRALPIEDVLTGWNASHVETLRLVEAFDEQALTPVMVERIAGDSYEHDAEHQAMLEAWLAKYQE
jgi:hypothetical protein